VPGRSGRDTALAVRVANGVLANVQAEMGLAAVFSEYAGEIRRLGRLRLHTDRHHAAAAAAATASGSHSVPGAFSGAGVDAVQARAQLLDDQRAARVLAAAPPAVCHMHRFGYRDGSASVGAAAAPAAVEGRSKRRQREPPLWSAHAFDFLVPSYDLDASPIEANTAAGSARRALVRYAADRVAAEQSSGGGAGSPAPADAASPLHLVITPASLALYARVHTFLLRVRRVGFELRRVWTALMGHKHRFAGAIRRPAAPAAATAATAGVAAGARASSASASTLGDGGGAIPLSVFTLRHEALHFITCLAAYVTSQVLEGGFDELMRDTARAACSIDGLRAAHEAYARRIAARCLLTPASSFSAPSSASAPGGAAAAPARGVARPPRRRWRPSCWTPFSTRCWTSATSCSRTSPLRQRAARQASQPPPRRCPAAPRRCSQPPCCSAWRPADATCTSSSASCTRGSPACPRRARASRTLTTCWRG
jgi:hypothetical protein